ncbi:hypothetical protein HYS42_00675 [Candidatus Saccharibacteria bacterium]|nr:hypothetical protein [Candidatus Saccharibacteria bacterium]
MVLESPISKQVKEAYRSLILGEIGFGKFEDMLKGLEAKRELTSHDRLWINLAMGKAATRFRNYEKAVEFFFKAFSLELSDCQQAEVLARRAYALLQVGRKTISDLDRAVFLGKAERQVGWALIRMRETDPYYQDTALLEKRIIAAINEPPYTRRIKFVCRRLVCGNCEL